jgi:hypothetical protein
VENLKLPQAFTTPTLLHQNTAQVAFQLDGETQTQANGFCGLARSKKLYPIEAEQFALSALHQHYEHMQHPILAICKARVNLKE